MIYSTVFGLLFFHFASSVVAVEYTNSTVLAGGRYKVWWAFNNDTDMFNFKVLANAVGWVGFGVTRLEYDPDSDAELHWDKNSMWSYDVVVGGIYGNGSGYFNVRT